MPGAVRENLVVSTGAGCRNPQGFQTQMPPDVVVYDGFKRGAPFHRGGTAMAASSSTHQHSLADLEQSELSLHAVFESVRPTDRKSGPLVLHLVASAGLIAALLAGCLWLPNVDHATVALLTVAAIVGLAALWGRLEALTGAIIGGLGYAYYFLPPRGFTIDKPEHMVALVAFLFVALVISQLAARSKQLLAQRDSLLNLSPDPLCIRDLDGNFQSANNAMLALLGVSEEELCSRPFLDLVHPEDRDRTAAAYRDLREGRSVVDLENRYRTKNGGWCWLHWKIAPTAPGAAWFNVAARDVTEERWAQEKLRDIADQVMTAQEEERRRIAGELHDDITQRLASLGIELGLLKRTEARAEALELHVSQIQAQILQLSEDVRKLSHSLHPSILEHSDLAVSLEMHCREFTDRHGIPTSFTTRDAPDGVPRPVALALYRIAQESLRNVARHSGATTANVVLAGEGGKRLSLYVIDNGKGFDISKSKISPGLGLVSIEERARHIGATVTIDSMPDEGTRLSVQVPLIREQQVNET
jgi:PAS domain S-box-containing protein